MHKNDLMRRWEGLAPTAAGLARSAGSLRTLTRRLSRAEGYEALRRLEKDLDKLDGLELEVDGLRREAGEVAREVRLWLNSEWGRRAHAVREDIAAYFEARGESVSQDDGLLLCAPFTVAIDPARDRARLLHAGEVVRTKLPLAPERVFKEWNRARELLERDELAADQLVAVLRESYKDVILLRELKQDSRVRLPDVHFQAFVRRQTPLVRQDPRKGRAKEYPRYQFAWDLGRLLEEGEILREAAIELFEASRTARESRSQSIRVDPPESKPLYLGDMRIGGTVGTSAVQ